MSGTTSWTPERVLAAAAAWVWVPADAESVRTEEYELIAYPPYFAFPTQVAWSRSERSAGELLDEVTERVHQWDRRVVFWWVSAATRPRDTEQVLRGHGAELAETVDVLAYDMAAALPDVPEPEDVRVELVRNEQTLRDLYVVDSEVWGEPYPDQERLAVRLAETLETTEQGTGFRVVAYVDDEPVSSGGCTIADGSARLWGGATRPGWRGRGAYRRVLMERVRRARELGATLALVKGRVESSAPILRRSGFTTYGDGERCYRLPV